MKNQLIKMALPVLVLGCESTFGYLYSLIGPDHGGFITQVEQDLVVKISLKLFGLVFSFCAARFALAKLSGIRICRIALIQAIGFLIRAIRKIRIPKAFSCLAPALACLEHWQGRLARVAGLRCCRCFFSPVPPARRRKKNCANRVRKITLMTLIY